MQFSHVILVHRYVENRCITERLPIHIAVVNELLIALSEQRFKCVFNYLFMILC